MWMFRRNSRRGVSPVIATVLIISMVVAAGAVVWVIVSNQLDKNSVSLGYSINSSADYNHDGKIDLLDLEITNVGTKATTINYVWNDGWKVVPGYNLVLNPKQTGRVLVGSSTIAGQLTPNEKVQFGVGETADSFELAKLTPKEPSSPGPTQITVLNGGSPVPDVIITFENEIGLPAPIPPLTTNSEGIATAYLLPDLYIAKASTGGESEQFHNVLNNSITIGQSGQKINVLVLDDTNTPISGITVYDANLQQNDLGQTVNTDATGTSSFTETDGSYLFRVNYLGTNYWSSSITVPGTDNANLTIKITSNAQLVGQLKFGDQLVGSGFLVYLYSANNASLGKHDYTNTSSYFEFLSGVNIGVYRLRLNYLNTYYWSGLISTSDTNLVVDFGGGNLNIEVNAGGSHLPNGVLTRLFHYTNSSAGKYDYLDGSGVANYGPIPGGDYLLRVDWLNQHFYSPVFTHTSSAQTSIDIGGGILNVMVTAGGEPLPNGVLTRLFYADNSSAGRYDYLNSTGWAEYGSLPNAQYRLRVDWLNQYFFTQAFQNDGSPHYLDIGGGNLRIQVQASGAPLPNGVLTRLFNADNSSAGRYDYLNSTGWAEYGAIPDGNYLLRIDWLNNYYYTSVFVSDGNPVVVDIGGGALNVHVLANGTPLPNGVLTRLFNFDNSSAGRYDYLNSTGWAEYGAIPSGDYLLRIDWLNNYYYTTVFTNNGNPVTVDIGGGALNVHVLANGAPLRNGVLTRLFNFDNSSAGRYDYLNSTGWAEYGAIPDGNYLLRIDWLNQYFYTSVFVNDGNPVTVDIGGGVLNIKVEIDGVALPQNVLTRLFNMNNVSAGIYDYINGSGFAEYGAIPAGNYLLRVDWLNYHYYTAMFLHDGQTSYTLSLNGLSSMQIHVTDDGNTIASGQRIRLYHADGTNTGLYAYTDGSSDVTFGPIPAGDYKVQYSSRYSASFTAQYSLSADIPPTPLFLASGTWMNISGLEIDRKET